MYLCLQLKAILQFHSKFNLPQMRSGIIKNAMFYSDLLNLHGRGSRILELKSQFTFQTTF